MSNIPVAGRTRSKSSGFQTLQPGSAATTSLLPTTDMAPDQQNNPTQDDEESDGAPNHRLNGLAQLLNGSTLGWLLEHTGGIIFSWLGGIREVSVLLMHENIQDLAGCGRHPLKEQACLSIAGIAPGSFASPTQITAKARLLHDSTRELRHQLDPIATNSG
eukprot:jgi/Psemu1/3322/gm1.3322_g